MSREEFMAGTRYRGRRASRRRNLQYWLRNLWDGGRIEPAVRTQVLERDGHACLRCGAPEPLVMDHIIPLEWRGRTVPDNLQTLCAHCNSIKGNKWAIDFRPLP
jgi:5-methylcytosine-specific restriction endonuclease McrA